MIKARTWWRGGLSVTNLVQKWKDHTRGQMPSLTDRPFPLIANLSTCTFCYWTTGLDWTGGDLHHQVTPRQPQPSIPRLLPYSSRLGHGRASLSITPTLISLFPFYRFPLPSRHIAHRTPPYHPNSRITLS